MEEEEAETDAWNKFVKGRSHAGVELAGWEDSRVREKQLVSILRAGTGGAKRCAGFLRKWVELELAGRSLARGRGDGPLSSSSSSREGRRSPQSWGGVCARVCKSRDEGREFPHNFHFVTEAGDKVKY